MNLFVLVYVSGALSLSQVYVAVNVLDMSVVDIYRCTHLLSPVLEARSVLLEFALNQTLSRNQRMRCMVFCFLHFSFSSDGLRRGCGLSLSIRF